MRPAVERWTPGPACMRLCALRGGVTRVRRVGSNLDDSSTALLSAECLGLFWCMDHCVSSVSEHMYAVPEGKRARYCRREQDPWENKATRNMPRFVGGASCTRKERRKAGDSVGTTTRHSSPGSVQSAPDSHQSPGSAVCHRLRSARGVNDLTLPGRSIRRSRAPTHVHHPLRHFQLHRGMGYRSPSNAPQSFCASTHTRTHARKRKECAAQRAVITHHIASCS